MTPELWGSPLQQYQPEIIVSAAAAPDKHTVANADIDCQSRRQRAADPALARLLVPGLP